MWAIPTSTSSVLKKKKKVPVPSLASRKPVRIRQSGRTGVRGVTEPQGGHNGNNGRNHAPRPFIQSDDPFMLLEEFALSPTVV